MIVLKIFAVYMLIGLVIEAIVNGKETVDGLTSGRYGYLDTFFGTIAMALIGLPLFIYGMFMGIKEEIENSKEGDI